MTMCENIKGLVKVYLMKNRGSYLSLCVLLLLSVVVQMIEVAGIVIADSEPDYFANMYLPGFMLLTILLLKGMGEYNILSMDGISMYPGTVKSRLISRLLCGHIEILVIWLASIVIYLLQAVFITVLSHLSDNVVVGSAFCPSYILWGLCRLLGIGLLAYAVWTLWYVILNRMPRRFLGVAYGLLGIGVFLVVRTRGSVFWVRLTRLIRLYGGTLKGYPAYTGILLCLATWLVLLVVAYLIGVRAKCWKRENRNDMVCSILIMYLLFIIVVGCFDYDEEEVVPDGVSGNAVTATLDVSALSGREIANLAGMGICQYEENAASGTPEKWEEMNIMTASMSESEAREASIPVPDGVMDSGHVYLVAWGEDTLFAGKDMIKPFLEYYCKNVSVQRFKDEEACTAVKRKPFVCPINAVYGNLNGILPDTTWHDTWPSSDRAVLVQLIVYGDEYAEYAAIED